MATSEMEMRTALDQQTAVTSHELPEAVTDPDINSNVNNGRLGWFDPQRGEIGDVEENNPNAFVRLDGNLVQEVADQNDQLLSIANKRKIGISASQEGEQKYEALKEKLLQHQGADFDRDESGERSLEFIGAKVPVTT